MRVGMTSLLLVTIFCGTTFAATPEWVEEGFTPIFDGETLDGWDGDPELWNVDDGSLHGQTKEGQLTKNQFLIWRGGEPGDFTLKLQFKMENGNSGVQIRSESREEWGQWCMGGYQVDMDASDTYTGGVYEERGGRGVMPFRGKDCFCDQEGVFHSDKVFADDAELKKVIKKGDWNDLVIIAKGFDIVVTINGVQTGHFTDLTVAQRKAKGLIGFQVHVGPPMNVWFRNIQIREE